MFDRLNFWLKFLWICLCKPFALVKHINGRNVSILVDALRSESPRVILGNLKDLLQIGPKSIETNSIDLFCDVITSTSKRIEIVGWAFSPNEIDKIRVFGDDVLLGKARYGLSRPDVFAEASDRVVSESVGFDFVTKEKGYKTIRLEAIDKSGKKVSIYRRSIEFSIEDQYQLIRGKGKKQSNKKYISIPSKPSIAVCLYVQPEDDTLLIKDIRKSLQSITSSFHPNCPILLLSTLERHQDSFEQRIHEGVSLQLCRYDNFKKTVNNTGCDYVLFLEVGDELTEDAYYRFQHTIESKKPAFVYYDEELLLADQKLPFPLFKPSFDIDLLTSYNYIGSSALVSVKKGNTINWFDENIGEKINVYQFFLKLVSCTEDIHNISQVLLKRHRNNEKLTNKEALDFYVGQNNTNATVVEGKVPNTLRLKRRLENPLKKVTIVIPFKDNISILKQCIDSVLDKTEYENYNLFLVSNDSIEDETYQYLNSIKDKRIQWRQYNMPFNFSEINNWAVGQIESDYVLFMNNDIVIKEQGWLTAMVEHIQREEIGAVGAKLLYPDNSIQHAGVIVGIYGVAAHGHKYFDTDESGYMNRINVIQRFSSCTAACLLVKRKLFLGVGGFEESLKVNFNDVDLCLKFKEKGYEIIYTPYAEAYHYESKTRVTDSPYLESEVAFIKNRWKTFLEKGDPHYNPNLTLVKRDFSLKV